MHFEIIFNVESKIDWLDVLWLLMDFMVFCDKRILVWVCML